MILHLVSSQFTDPLIKDKARSSEEETCKATSRTYVYILKTFSKGTCTHFQEELCPREKERNTQTFGRLLDMRS